MVLGAEVTRLRVSLLLLIVCLVAVVAALVRAPGFVPGSRTCSRCGGVYVEFPYSDGRCSGSCYWADEVAK